MAHFICPAHCGLQYYKGEHKWEITDAAGDGFHWGGTFHNEYP